MIDWCFTARQHKIGQFVPIYQGGLLAQAFEDSQRGNIYIYLLINISISRSYAYRQAIGKFIAADINKYNKLSE